MVVLLFGVAFQLSFLLEVIRFALFGQFDFLRWCFLGFFGETIRQDYQGCVFKAAELHTDFPNVVRVDQFLAVSWAGTISRPSISCKTQATFFVCLPSSESKKSSTGVRPEFVT
jgi:hypothetical protein